ALVAARKWIWAAAVVLVLMGFGWVRLQTGSYGAPVKVGMVVIPEAEQRKEAGLLGRYSMEIQRLAAEGARVVVLPEKVLTVTDTTRNSMYDSLAQMAGKLKIGIVAGVTGRFSAGLKNLAPVFGQQGQLLADYEKVHLFEGEMYEGFGHGSKPGIFGDAGVAICKDLDFESYMRNYGRAGIGVLYAPAWDFVRDGWWHSRIAIVGAVANGYSLVRNPRAGRMTISDDRGRVSFEASSEGLGGTRMTGTVRPARGHTLYSRLGDWFDWLMAAAAVSSLVYLAASRSFTRV
ncbi:MAG TPA: carbon-nitrogen hydrolase family protein, partial [Bryobacteraceae bacterium]